MFNRSPQPPISLRIPSPRALCILLPPAVLVAGLVAGTARAEETTADPEAAGEAMPIEEIVVTSEFRQTTVDRTPASVSVLSLADVRGRALNHMEEILDQVPNLNFSGGTSRARYFQIRGIGELSQFEEPLNSSVGLLIDGVDFSGIGTAAVLHDVAQVEVLRGPQGTLYGANALAGLIQVRTNDPTETLEAGVTLDAANYNGRGIGATLSGPLGDTLAGRLAVHKYQDDGFYDNVYLHRSDTNRHDELSLRGKLAFTPTDRLSVDLATGYVDVDNGYDAFSLDNDRHTRSDEPGHDRQSSGYASLKGAWLASDAVIVEGSLGYAASDIDYAYDEDWTYVGFHPDGYSSTDRYQRERDTTTVEVRALSGDAGRLFGGRSDWVVGLYVLDQSVDFTRTYTFFPVPFTSRYEMHRLALYGELETALSERARLVVGVRGERHRSDYRDSESVRFDPEDHLWGGRLVLEYDLTDTTMIYGAATRGYKAGGFNPSNSLDPELREYDPETLWNLEAGLKGRWFDGRLTGRFSAFYMRREDVQAGTSIVRLRADGSSEFIQLTSNAARGINSGLEAEVTWAATDRLTLFGNLGLLHTEFRDFIDSSGEDLDGEPQAHAPAYNFFAGAEYRFPAGFFGRLEVEGKDDFYYSDSRRFSDRPDDLRSDPYTLLNASFGYDRSGWSVRVWGQNLTDKDYTVRGFYFPNDPRDGYTERGWFQLGEPRRYGVTLDLKF
ncbi:MAG: TonB-dependent receptor [Pseudomonadales bacterium]|jgi:outer membrane receptor protein involved in Fe transport